MAFESSCRSKLSKLVTDHVLSYIDRNKFISIMNCKCMTYKFWKNSRTT